MQQDMTPPMDMGQMPQQQGADPMMGGQGTPMDNQFGDPSMGQGGMPPQDMDPNGGGSEFDTGFDAGVDADEDEDPKRFIQQLTGKLSQSLNSYNNEMGGDEELSKYVGKMIVKAAVKGLDDKGRKDLIKAVNTADEADYDDDMGDEEVDDMEDMEPEGGEPMPDQMQECTFSKKELGRLVKEARKPKKVKSPFVGKRFGKTR